MTHSHLVPVHLRFVEGRPHIRWYEVDGIYSYVPFFHQWWTRSRRCCQYSITTTTLHDAEALVESRPSISSIGFIFHMPRSGSTLVSNMLATFQATQVISEAQPIHAVLTNQEVCCNVEDAKRLLTTIITGLSASIESPNLQLVIKLVSTDVFGLPIIHASYPLAPWIFIYRDPVEVMVSAIANNWPDDSEWPPQDGRIWSPQTLIDGILMSREEKCAFMLRAICECVLQHANNRLLTVDYSDILDVIFSLICPHLQIDPDARDILAAKKEAQYYSKHAEIKIPFIPDGFQKQRQALSTTIQLAHDIVGKAFSELAELKR